MVFTTDLLFYDSLTGKKIGYIQKQGIASRLYSPEKKLMFYIQQTHQHFQFITNDLSFVCGQLYGILLILPHRCQQNSRYLGKIRVICPHGLGNGEGDKLNIRTRIKMIGEIIRSMNKQHIRLYHNKFPIQQNLGTAFKNEYHIKFTIKVTFVFRIAPVLIFTHKADYFLFIMRNFRMFL